MGLTINNMHSKYSLIHGLHKKDNHGSHINIPSSAENSPTTTVTFLKLDFERHHSLALQGEKGVLNHKD
jgi:hypothetical protein